MVKRINAVSILLSLLALAVVYVLGAAFFTLELERLAERTITPLIEASPEVSALNRGIYSGIGRFMASNNVRLIGCACLGLTAALALAGLAAGKKRLASLGGIGFILPVYAYFVLHMSFLAGLGVLTALWAPLWGDLVRLGDIAYLPYMALVYPFSLAGMDIRRFLAGLFSSLGLLLFILGVLAWLYARFRKKDTADFWIYRFTRHPQYLGWIVWSYGLMLQVALRRDTALHGANPGASLPWAVSALIIVCVALSEDIRLRRARDPAYERYGGRTAFMIPLPGFAARAVSAPFRLLRGKEKPETGWDLVLIFFLYLGAIALLSTPFILFNWPPGGWMGWP